MRGAGGGAPAKPEGQRRNRTKPAHETVALPATGREGPSPTPTVALAGGARRLWDALWSRPEASQWSEADVPALTRMVWLESNRKVWTDSRLLAEVRQLEDRFGLNPYARRQLRWRIEDEVEADVIEPGRWADLRVVDG